ncbi:helix-turn-helix domain-containing protein [Kitasatospora sp. NPDC059795]|uniref:helix-turn-helix domain-containing protein n=1 Tax=Kitasatospora sp. NPDC059795 TaxID=3346949 RepID=UPI00365BDA6B
MDTSADLGEFLRSRRALLQPQDVGLNATESRRRVPGLRREELALLAGVSVAYYTRLEQGQSVNASDGVLDAVARALRLDGDEHAHLHALARPDRASAGRSSTPRPERVRASTRHLIAALDRIPAVVLNHRYDFLAWNPLGHALLAGHLDPSAPDLPAERPNLARLLFLDPHTRELFTHWEAETKVAVAALRLTVGRYPEDRQLAELVGQLAIHSPEFASLWARHPVRECTAGTKSFHHPLVGELDLGLENLRPSDSSDHRILLYIPEPGSPSAAAVDLLAGTLQR